jgi:hypothetical protein
MSGDDFASDAQQYAALEAEMSTEVEGEAGGVDQTMALWEGPIDHSEVGTRERQQYEQAERQQNARHVQAVQRGAQQQQQPQQQQRYTHDGVPYDARGFPSREEDPIGHFTARQDAMEQQQVEAQFWDHVQRSEQAARENVSDYNEAIQFLEQNRRDELTRTFPNHHPQVQATAKQWGMTVPQLREYMLNQDRISVAQHAIQQGQSPAELYYRIAQTRGWQGKPSLNRNEVNNMVHLAGHDWNSSNLHDLGDQFDQWWDHYARAGRL